MRWRVCFCSESLSWFRAVSSFLNLCKCSSWWLFFSNCASKSLILPYIQNSQSFQTINKKITTLTRISHAGRCRKNSLVVTRERRFFIALGCCCLLSGLTKDLRGRRGCCDVVDWRASIDAFVCRIGVAFCVWGVIVIICIDQPC